MSTTLDAQAVDDPDGGDPPLINPPTKNWDYNKNAHDEPSSDDDTENGAGTALLGGTRKPSTRHPRSAGYHSKHDEQQDVSDWGFVKNMLIESVPTLLVTVFGMVFTGELLERVSRWNALRATDELFVLIPIINNLKGNLEMNLSARLGTAANMGQLSTRAARKPLLVGNMMLLQAQALLVSAISAVLSFVLGVIAPPNEQMPMEMPQDNRRLRRRIVEVGVDLLKRDTPEYWRRAREFFVVLSTSMISASLSGLILGGFMCSLVLVCQKRHLNPDNIAPPLASCLGDLLTMTLLGLSATALSFAPSPIPLFLFLTLVGLTAVTFRATLRMPDVRELVGSGWTPLFGAMIISSGTGMVLEQFVRKYEGFGLMAIVVTGLPGAIGAISVSGPPTLLHAENTPKGLGKGRLQILSSPLARPTTYRPLLTAGTLFAIGIPVQIVFLGFVYASGWMNLPFIFVVMFAMTFCLSVAFSLAMAHWLTLLFWAVGCDPDNYCLPVHSALVDLVGQLLLVCCYELVSRTGTDVVLGN